jgi:hypothetical protein
MTELNRPIPESYWVVPARFLAGEYPAAPYEGRARERLNRFLEAGIDTFFDLTIQNELPPYLSLLREQASLRNIDVRYERFSILDRSIPMRGVMTGILTAIDSALAEGRNVYVHCWGGIGRTGTTVGCYLVHHGLSGQQALAQLAELWKDVPKSSYFPRSPETDRQVKFILNWENNSPSLPPSPDPQP